MSFTQTALDSGNDNFIMPFSSTPPKKVTGSLKICLISETFHAGVGRHIVDVACALSARGHEVHLAYSPVRQDPQFLAAIQQVPAIRCHPIPMPRKICPADISAFLQIKKYVQANGPFDIVHGESSKGGGYARLLKLFGVGTVIYSPHAFATLSPVVPFVKRLVYGVIEVALARLTDTIICASHAEKEHGQSLGISQRKLAVIAHGSTPMPLARREIVRASLGLSSDQVAIGFVGRMEDQKAPQRLIDAALQILPELPQVHFVMIGDGPKRKLLEHRLQEAGLADRVTWLGAVDARQYMSAMDIFALSSLYEGFAYVLLEALYAGLPIVSTPVGGTHESILQGSNGFIVPHDSQDQMAAALRQLVLDADLRRSMAKASSERAIQFSIPRMIDATERLYFKTLATRRGIADVSVATVQSINAKPRTVGLQ